MNQMAAFVIFIGVCPATTNNPRKLVKSCKSNVLLLWPLCGQQMHPRSYDANATTWVVLWPNCGVKEIITGNLHNHRHGCNQCKPFTAHYTFIFGQTFICWMARNNSLSKILKDYWVKKATLTAAVPKEIKTHVPGKICDGWKIKPHCLPTAQVSHTCTDPSQALQSKTTSRPLLYGARLRCSISWNKAREIWMKLGFHRRLRSNLKNDQRMYFPQQLWQQEGRRSSNENMFSLPYVQNLVCPLV